jgi:hypothetical protein
MADNKHDTDDTRDAETRKADEKQLKDAAKKLATTSHLQATAHSLLGKK